ncbi:MAG: hypothetical protein HPZ79_09285 [Oscillospiraceae bacterium]|nr:hypothetical protein [Oscillospiraceae bacterium]
MRIRFILSEFAAKNNLNFRQKIPILLYNIRNSRQIGAKHAQTLQKCEKNIVSYLTALAEWAKLQLLAFSGGVLRSGIGGV